MKIIFSIITIFAITFSGFSQNGVYVKYETEIDVEDDADEAAAMMMIGSTMEVASGAEKTWVKTEMGTMMTIELSLDIESNEMTLFMSGMMGNMAYRGNADDLGDEQEETEMPDLELVDETKVILDMECKKAVITDSSGNQTIYWYTEDFKRPKGMDQMPNNIPGLCLEFEVVSDGMTMTYTAVEFNDEAKMENYEIVIPEGVEIQDLKTMGNSGQ